MYALNRDRKGGDVCLYVSSIYSSCILKVLYDGTII